MQKKTINLSGVSAETWTRTIFLFLTLINQILSMFGKKLGFEFTENEIYQVVSMIMTAIASVMAWWKNNSFSLSAQAGDAVMKTLEGDIEYMPPAEDANHHHEVG